MFFITIIFTGHLSLKPYYLIAKNLCHFGKAFRKKKLKKEKG